MSSQNGRRRSELDEVYAHQPTWRGIGWVLKWAVAALFVIWTIGAMTSGANWMWRWAIVPAQVFSPENVREQWRFAYDYDASLKAIAIQVCNAERVLATSPDTDKSQRQTQVLAIENNYARVAGEYNGRLSDAFRAGRVRPADVPDRAPSLEAAKVANCST